MFSRFQRFYTSIKVVTDLAMLTLAFVLAYLTRFFGPFPKQSPQPSDTLMTLLMVLLIFPLAFKQARLYSTNRSRTHIQEIFELFKAMITGGLVMIALTYFIRDRYSRVTLALFLGDAFILIAVSRLLARHVMNELRRRGYNLKSILVIGGGELGERVIETIHSHRELGFRITGVLSRHAYKVGKLLAGAPIIGVTSEISEVLDKHAVDQVLIALPLEDQVLIKQLMEKLALRTVDVKVVPDFYQYMTLYGGLEEFGGLPIISLQGVPLDGWNQIAKRVFDILVSSLAILVTAPIMVGVAFLVRFTSSGPILFRQERMGLDGRTFNILKFRTMRVDAEAQGGAQMAVSGDLRRTSLGAIFRTLSIDEMPQLFNVFRGDMSLVGPRPERPVFIEEFKRQIPKYHLRHKVKSGITGWAQINGLRGQTSIQKRIEYDLYYIENWSLLLDLKILVRTALGGFLSKNAY